MKYISSFDIRKSFFDFFIERDHLQVPSSSLIPAEDPTLLFANAGMNQFKDIFLGKEKRSYSRAVSIQKCIRAGGKHNDLENVGFTKRHLTFFEMVGNFSFGDYFKKDAIIFAWDFLTKIINLDQNRLYATVYTFDNDAFDIWEQVIKLPKQRISRLGAADNFWQMGETGPCGPCSEIYFDRGLAFGCKSEQCAPGCSCDRFLEIWNLVFMEFNRQPDGTDVPLKQTGVDTGMGLERLCSILQNKDSVFETDLFMPIINKIESLTKIDYESADTNIKGAFRVLADHIRSVSFAIADGCIPSNEGRGYVLRKIIRRAILFSQKLGSQDIFPQLLTSLVDYMGPIYPELILNQSSINSILKAEIERFSNSLISGQQILDIYFKQNQNSKIISGEQAFKLYDTYGFPLEITKLIADSNGFTVDTVGFEKHMEIQKKQSGQKNSNNPNKNFILKQKISSEFTGYQEFMTKAEIKALILEKDGEIQELEEVTSVPENSNCYFIPDKTPFYIQGGGQISDQGFIEINKHKTKILDLKKFETESGFTTGILVKAPINIKVGDLVEQYVDKEVRLNTMKNHTATHLLQAALISIFGKQIKQSGSVVTPDYLRYDFSYDQNLTPEQISLVETIINQKIMDNILVTTEQTNLETAKQKGVIAFFGEKYNPENVRVVTVPGFSAELCGGTHVTRTGDIGSFKITDYSSPASGIKRFIAVTGPKAVELFQYSFNIIKKESQEFKVSIESLPELLLKQKEEIRQDQQNIKELRKTIINLYQDIWLDKIEIVKNIPFLYLDIDQNIFGTDLRSLAQDLSLIKPGFYFLISTNNSKSQFIAILSKDFTNQIDLTSFVGWLKSKNIQGGQKKNIIQGGSSDINQNFKQDIIDWLANNIK